MDLKKIWNNLEAFFKDNAPKIIPTLNAGLDEKDLLAFEKKWNTKLPEDFKDSCKIHNGQPRNNHIHFIVIKDSYWLWPIEEIDKECDYIINICKRKLESIPFAYAGNGDKIYINVSSDKSKYGKVNYYSHDGGGGTIEKTFAGFLESQYQRMINKEIVPDDEDWFSLSELS